MVMEFSEVKLAQVKRVAPLQEKQNIFTFKSVLNQHHLEISVCLHDIGQLILIPFSLYLIQYQPLFLELNLCT